MAVGFGDVLYLLPGKFHACRLEPQAAEEREKRARDDEADASGGAAQSGGGGHTAQRQDDDGQKSTAPLPKRLHAAASGASSKCTRPSPEEAGGASSRPGHDPGSPPFSLAQLQVLLVRTRIRKASHPSVNGPDQYGAQSGRWGPPKGHVQRTDVSELAAAAREFHEETGLSVPSAVLEAAMELGLGLCNAKPPKTLKMFALEAWAGLSDESGDGVSLAPKQDEVDLMEWWPVVRAIAPPWQAGMAVQRAATGDRPLIGIHPPKARFVKELVRYLVQQGVCAPAEDVATWEPERSGVTGPRTPRTTRVGCWCTDSWPMTSNSRCFAPSKRASFLQRAGVTSQRDRPDLVSRS
eukprot:1173577-Prymnesium_polylepis.1